MARSMNVTELSRADEWKFIAVLAALGIVCRKLQTFMKRSRILEKESLYFSEACT